MFWSMSSFHRACNWRIKVRGELPVPEVVEEERVSWAMNSERIQCSITARANSWERAE